MARGDIKSPTSKRRPRGQTPDEQFAAAQRRIQQAKDQEWKTLILSDFPKLSKLPAEIAELQKLEDLQIGYTKIDDLSPLSNLPNLETLRASFTPVRDLAPLSGLPALRSLYLRKTRIADLNPLSELISLEGLWLDGTPISNVILLSKLPNLTSLWIGNTRVSDIAGLSQLPLLRNLSLTNAPISDFAPLAEFRTLGTLSLEGTSIEDLTPLAQLEQLEGLSLVRTPVRDLTFLRGLLRLKRLHLTQTRISDLTPLAELATLQMLLLNDTTISDIAPIAGLTALQKLSLDNTLVSDLAALAGATSLQDSAVRQPSGETGLFYNGSSAARIAPFDQLVQLDQPDCTIQTINEIRRQQGLPAHILPPDESIDNEEENQRAQLGQRPASHSFAFRSGRIEAQAQIFTPPHPDVAGDIRNEVSEKAKEASHRLRSCNAPRRMISTVVRLDSSLGESLEDVRAGILQMRFRSLEADVAAYDTEEGRRELPEDALAMVRDLASSVEDLMGCFPQLADIEAERLAQRLKDTDVLSIVDALSKIREVAEESDAVAPSAVEALKAGEPELEHDNEIIDSGASEPARTAAANARDRTVGYMLLVYRNFIAGAVKAGSELAGLGDETWKDFRKKAPEQLSNASVALIVASLVNALLGPTAAVGAFALSFKPLRDRAKRVADELTSLTKKARAGSKETDEIKADNP
jgi:Leucine-rich repeat (LRR) protein